MSRDSPRLVGNQHGQSPSLPSQIGALPLFEGAPVVPGGQYHTFMNAETHETTLSLEFP